MSSGQIGQGAEHPTLTLDSYRLFKGRRYHLQLTASTAWKTLNRVTESDIVSSCLRARFEAGTAPGERLVCRICGNVARIAGPEVLGEVSSFTLVPQCSSSRNHLHTAVVATVDLCGLRLSSPAFVILARDRSKRTEGSVPQADDEDASPPKHPNSTPFPMPAESPSLTPGALAPLVSPRPPLSSQPLPPFVLAIPDIPLQSLIRVPPPAGAAAAAVAAPVTPTSDRVISVTPSLASPPTLFVSPRLCRQTWVCVSVFSSIRDATEWAVLSERFRSQCRVILATPTSMLRMQATPDGFRVAVFFTDRLEDVTVFQSLRLRWEAEISSKALAVHLGDFNSW